MTDISDNASRPDNKLIKQIEWRISDGLTDYDAALAEMEKRVALIHAGKAAELIWLLEHPPLYTAGTSAKSGDLISPDRFPVHKTGRGGQYTYHGPGQRVVYVMLDLKRFGGDVRAFVTALEDWIIATLATFNLKGERREGRVGIWVARPDMAPHSGSDSSSASGSGRDDKIAALGIRVRRWISFHGISINVDPDLEHFSGITPCGISDHGVTSLNDLGYPVSMADVDLALRSCFENSIGAEIGAAAGPKFDKPNS